MSALRGCWFLFLFKIALFGIQIRSSIKALFPERDCFTLVRPLEAEQRLQHLDEIPVWMYQRFMCF